MKVIHINENVKLMGGAEVYIQQCLSLQRTMGVEVHLIGLERNGSEVKMTSPDPALNWHGPIEQMALSPLASLIDGDTLFHVHQMSEPKIISQLIKLAPIARHMHEPRMMCPGQGKFFDRSERICTKPYGLHCLRNAYTQRCCNRHPIELWHRFTNTSFEINQASQHYAALIANSSYIADEALKVGYPRDKLHIIPCFTEATPEPDWEMTTDPVITFAGRLSRTKGVHYLLRAFSLVLCNLPEARLEILGSGPDEQMFRQLAEHLNATDSVHFHGWVDQDTVDDHLSRSAVVAFPSICPEAFGMTGIEAMVRGKPVVCFDVGGVRDWIQDKRTGYVVQPKDTEAYARALEKLLREPALRTRMGRLARNVAAEDFSAHAHYSMLERLYESILRRDF